MRMTNTQPEDTAAPTRIPRRSACLTQSHARELTRLRGLSVAARIEEALTMNNRFSGLNPVTQANKP